MSDTKRTLFSTTGLSGLWSRVKGFRKDENGTMLVFGLSIFVMMMWAGGMAIDFMRFEHDRAQVQYTLDRAALAAASLRQPLDCEDVAKDYFAKSGLDNTRIKVSGECSVLSKVVTIEAETEVKSFFINMMGIESMTAAAVTTAEEREQNVEVSLVLDISGSMRYSASGGGQTKIEALRDAAEEFLDILLVDSNADRVSINLIPYSMQVNAGKDVLDQLNVTSQHDLSHCIDFDGADFNTVEISDGVEKIGTGSLGGTPMGTAPNLKRTEHFDPYYRTRNHPGTSWDDGSSRSYACSTDPDTQMVVMSQNKDHLIERINSWTPGGTTSIDLGIKWGSYLLNPSANSLVTSLPSGSTSFSPNGPPTTQINSSGVEEEVQATRELPSAFSDRPLDYGLDNTLKFLIVLTDGVNTDQAVLNSSYADGYSTLWWDPSHVDDSEAGWFSHYKPRYGQNNDYFMSNGDVYKDYFNGSRRHASHAQRMTWREVWEVMGVKYFAYYFNYARDWSRNEYYRTIYDVIDYVDPWTKDDRMVAACDAAKLEGVRVFSIGFEVSEDSAYLLEDCASNSSDFFVVKGDEIKDAFGRIAQTIQRLKLTN